MEPPNTPNKVLIFSRTKKMLNVIEKLIQDRSYRYCRMDGDVPVVRRQAIIEQYNTDQDIFLFCLTTKVGGLGINLTSANKVIIFDPDWNPMVDTQATDRALRIGQKRDVIIYRLLVDDTVEEKIYHRQIWKKFQADQILKNPSCQKQFDQQTIFELLEKPSKYLNLVKHEEFLGDLKGTASKERKSQIKSEY